MKPKYNHKGNTNYKRNHAMKIKSFNTASPYKVKTNYLWKVLNTRGKILVQFNGNFGECNLKFWKKLLVRFLQIFSTFYEHFQKILRKFFGKFYENIGKTHGKFQQYF